MQLLTYRDVEAWCLERAITILPNRRLASTDTVQLHMRVDLPQATYKLPLLAKDLVSLAFKNSRESLLLWVCEWRIWNEEIEVIGTEHFQRLRSTYSNVADLNDFPGQTIPTTEELGAAALLIFPILFGWDAYLIGPRGDPKIFVSHDEFVEVNVSDPTLALLAAERLQEWNPTEIVRQT